MTKNKIYAKDFKCCKCGAQAETFWPCIDPDIKSHPFCKKCVQEEQVKVMIAIADEKLPSWGDF